MAELQIKATQSPPVGSVTSKVSSITRLGNIIYLLYYNHVDLLGNRFSNGYLYIYLLATDGSFHLINTVTLYAFDGSYNGVTYGIYCNGKYLMLSYHNATAIVNEIRDLQGSLIYTSTNTTDRFLGITSTSKEYVATRSTNDLVVLAGDFTVIETLIPPVIPVGISFDGKNVWITYVSAINYMLAILDLQTLTLTYTVNLGALGNDISVVVDEQNKVQQNLFAYGNNSGIFTI